MIRRCAGAYMTPLASCGREVTEVGYMASMRQMAHKLQTALCQKGRYIKINQYQSHSERQGRMVTKYVLQETRTLPTGRRKAVTILETYQFADVVKKLAAIYSGGDSE